MHKHMQHNKVGRKSQHQSKSHSVESIISFCDKYLLYCTGEKRKRKLSWLNSGSIFRSVGNTNLGLIGGIT